ncbi:MAG: hypothetical protein WCO50_04715, partial [Synechococcus sp. ELA619]
ICFAIAEADCIGVSACVRVITLVTCGFGSIVTGLIGLIEGIIYITKTPEEFQATYVDAKKEWF